MEALVVMLGGAFAFGIVVYISGWIVKHVIDREGVHDE